MTIVTLLASTLLLTPVGAVAQPPSAPATPAPQAPAASPTPNPDYDPALAQRLGADAQGMKMYVLVLLKAGPKSDLPKEENDRAFAGHFANMKRLAELGKLSVAGPLGRNDRYRGIFIFNVPSVAEAETLLATDPAVAAGALAGELYPLYGSAALQEVVPIHKRLMKE
jgi:uncharacterized protein YciI